MSNSAFAFPEGKRFAFTIIDDADDGTVENLAPVYDLLESLGMRVTKTVWPVDCPEGSRDFSAAQTLADADYRAFVVDLAKRGFEITWHGATMESSTRERTIAALDRYAEVFGAYPRIHVNHAGNRENMYWGPKRFDSALIRALLDRFSGWSSEPFEGDVEHSPYWWGDMCARHFIYCRNLTTNAINTARFNPSMPYVDPKRPLVAWWFSASDANDVDEFNALIESKNQQQLERDGGFCVVATHFGKRFARGGVVDATLRKRLTELASRDGWFPTVGDLLDHLRRRRFSSGGRLAALEWQRMQWQYMLDRGIHALRRQWSRMVRDSVGRAHHPSE